MYEHENDAKDFDDAGRAPDLNSTGCDLTLLGQLPAGGFAGSDHEPAELLIETSTAPQNGLRETAGWWRHGY